MPLLIYYYYLPPSMYHTKIYLNYTNYAIYNCLIAITVDDDFLEWTNVAGIYQSISTRPSAAGVLIHPISDRLYLPIRGLLYLPISGLRHLPISGLLPSPISQPAVV